jgi:hypothetical protein
MTSRQGTGKLLTIFYSVGGQDRPFPCTFYFKGGCFFVDMFYEETCSIGPHAMHSKKSTFIPFLQLPSVNKHAEEPDNDM